jgi:hypothetical protein
VLEIMYEEGEEEEGNMIEMESDNNSTYNVRKIGMHIRGIMDK